MSERSFSRHYAGATGQTPARAVERLRVEAARRLLSETRLPVKQICRRCGFGSEETMRRSFLRVLVATPQDYRARSAPDAQTFNRLSCLRNLSFAVGDGRGGDAERAALAES